jgi:hypothetical protein
VEISSLTLSLPRTVSSGVCYLAFENIIRRKLVDCRIPGGGRCFIDPSGTDNHVQMSLAAAVLLR